MTKRDSIASAPAGRFQGVEQGDALIWRGIRYATARRFAPAERCDTADGLIDARTDGPACPQRTGFSSPAQIGAVTSEDCLVLNIFSPAAAGGGRPVMVWLHGGAFAGGSAKTYDGSTLAARGDIVVVALNYRLGLLGFLGIDSLDIPANLGLHDQIVALQWIRDNIAAFGGDPDRITLAGESAGSMSISLLMLADDAKGLFHGAIMQSGALNLIHDRATQAAFAGRCVELLGADAADIESLRRLPVERLLDVQAQMGEERPGIVPAAPCYDGVLLPESLSAARAAPTHAIPLLAGHNREESRIFELKALRGVLPLRRSVIQSGLAEQLGEDAAQHIVAHYGHTKKDERALAADLSFAMPTRHFAERHAARGNASWFYRFDRGGPFLGATHGIELAYLWGWTGWQIMMLTGGPMIAGRAALARRMQDFWIAFVRNGDPGPDWPAFDPTRQSVYLLDTPCRVADDPDAARRKAWAGADVLVGAIRPEA